MSNLFPLVMAIIEIILAGVAGFFIAHLRFFSILKRLSKETKARIDTQGVTLAKLGQSVGTELNEENLNEMRREYGFIDGMLYAVKFILDNF